MCAAVHPEAEAAHYMSDAAQSAASRRAAALEHWRPVLQELPQPALPSAESPAQRPEQPRLELAAELQPPQASRPRAQPVAQPQPPVAQTPQAAAPQPVPWRDGSRSRAERRNWVPQAEESARCVAVPEPQAALQPQPGPPV